MLNLSNIKYTFEDRGNLADLATIDTATATVDITPAFKVNPTSAGRTYTLSNPTDTANITAIKIWNASAFDFKVNGIDCSANSITTLTFSGATWQISGGGSSSVASQVVTTTTALTDWNRIVLVDATAGAVTLTLPDANAGLGKSLEIVKTDSTVNTVTVLAAGGDTISGIQTTTLYTQNQASVFRSTGANAVQQVSTNVPFQDRLAPTLTSAFTASVNFDVYRVTAAVPYAVTLPLSTTVGNKRWYFKKTDATNNIISITCSGAETIDGAATFQLFTANQSVTVVSNGANGYARID